ncbi:MAG: hypothetical protein PHF79_02630 [Candidatus Pacebacteria bacterium]|nr:hypothetical protein [Candidatus Paceibacterota bacterium]
MDTTFIHADLFFFISSLGFIILFLMAVVASIYVIVILKNVKDFSKRIKMESEVILDEVHEFRSEMRSRGRTAASVLKGLLGAFGVAQAVRRARGRRRPAQNGRTQDQGSGSFTDKE